VLAASEIAPDFALGETTLYEILEQRSVVLFFFPKAFTPG
jgi:peroxiredoxin